MSCASDDSDRSRHESGHSGPHSNHRNNYSIRRHSSKHCCCIHHSHRTLVHSTQNHILDRRGQCILWLLRYYVRSRDRSSHHHKRSIPSSLGAYGVHKYHSHMHLVRSNLMHMLGYRLRCSYILLLNTCNHSRIHSNHSYRCSSPSPYVHLGSNCNSQWHMVLSNHCTQDGNHRYSRHSNGDFPYTRRSSVGTCYRYELQNMTLCVHGNQC